MSCVLIRRDSYWTEDTICTRQTNTKKKQKTKRPPERGRKHLKQRQGTKQWAELCKKIHGPHQEVKYLHLQEEQNKRHYPHTDSLPEIDNTQCHSNTIQTNITLS